MDFSSSKKLIFNLKHIKNISYFSVFKKANESSTFFGWGKRKSGQKAIELAKKYKAKFTLLEDGFIRSISLSSKPFGLVFDDVGIYYDASTTSKLENILLNEEFSQSKLKKARNAINYILENNISKYNDNLALNEFFIKKYNLDKKENILLIPQTLNDASLIYGNSDNFSFNEIADIAIKENPNANILLKIHPDVLSGKKSSNVDISSLPKNIKIISENINPIELLKKCKKVYTKTSGMGFEAMICGCEVVLFGSPFYAGWGLSDDRIDAPKRRTRKLSLEEIFYGAYIKYCSYFDLHTNKKSDILEVLKQIKLQREFLAKNTKKLYLFGFSIWKRGYCKPFISQFEKYFYINTYSKNPLKSALAKGLDKNSQIYIWGRKNYEKIEEFAKQNNIKITRVEDGFIRSVGLGCELTRPYSLVFDNLGIYFDTTKESALEKILNEHNFKECELEEALKLKEILIKSKISKYNNSHDEKLEFCINKTRILVIGQVDDDASIRFGTDNMSNLALLKQVKKECNSAFIIYKPHPDVLSGVRAGNIADEEALKYCDKIAKNYNLADLIKLADEVHTMTSLGGLEALIRGKKVVCYGRAFWAGWGLSDDKMHIPRRKRKLSIDELIAGVYLLYPRYLHPNTLKPCFANELIIALKEQKEALKNPWILIKTRIRSFLMISSQQIFKWVKNDNK